MKSFFAKLGHFFTGVGRSLYRAEPTIANVVEKIDPRDANKIQMAQSVIDAVKGGN
jgi:hypothetical protein